MTPALRFPEFEADWLTAKLGDIFTFKNGVNADKSMYGSGRKFINVMDVIADAPIYHDAIIGSVEISDKEFAKNDVVFGDILFQRSSETREEVGQSNIYLDEKPATFGGFVIRGHPKKPIISRYFDALLKTSAVRKDVTSRSGGSTRYNIGQESLEAVAICIAPTDAEQQKISDFIVAVDERIKLLRRRRDAVQLYKRGIMQRIFSQSTRFKRDDGSAFPDWEEMPFAKITKRASEKFDPTTSVETPMTIELENIESGTGRITGHGALSDQLSLKGVFRKGDILFGKLRPYLNKYWLADSSGVCSSEIWILRAEGAIAAFVFYLIQTKNFMQSANQSSGSKMPRADWSVVGAAKFSVPHPDEQQKIADFLSALDAKITAVTAQVEQMQAFKKGLLQQMFV